MLAYLAGNVGPSCGYVGLMLTHVEPKDPKNGNSKKKTVMLTHVEPKDPKNGNSKKKTVKRGSFWPDRVVCGLGARLAQACGPILGLCWPILGRCWPILGRGWPILALCWPILGLCWAYEAYVGLDVGPILRAMLAYATAREPLALLTGSRPCVGPWLGLCWPMLAHLVAMLAYVGLMLIHWARKMGTAKKRCKTQDILMVGGLSWGYVGPSWSYVGLSWGQCGPMLAHVDPS